MPHNRHMCRLISLCFILSLVTLSSSYAADNRYRVAVVDSGMDLSDVRFKDVLCQDGHIDFTKTGIFDTIGHGTEMASLIMQEAKSVEGKYCIVVYKVFTPTNQDKSGEQLIVEAFKEAVRLKIPMVNLSARGPDKFIEEYITIRKGILSGTTFVVAAGNESINMNEPGHEFYPVCYKSPNLVKVGSINKSGARSSFSNYGCGVNEWEIGEEVLALAPRWACSILESNCRVTGQGTSQATAIHTGKLVKKALSK